MPRNNYRDKNTRRRHTAAWNEPEQSEYEILMTNEAGTKVKTVKVQGSSGVNAWNRAIRQGLDNQHRDGLWFPIEIMREDTGWKYAAF